MKIDQAKIRYPADKKSDIKRVTRSSIFTEGVREEIKKISLAKLVPYSKQARQHFNEDSLQKMADTIRSHGIRQPLTVLSVSSDQEVYEVVSGERRMRAAKLAGLDRVPCIVIYEPKQAFEISIIENLQRENLHPIEFSLSLKALIDEGVCRDQKEISKKIGISKGAVSESLSYLTIEKSLFDKIIKNNIAVRRDIRAIRDAGDIKARETLIDQLILNNTPTGSTKNKITGERKSRRQACKVLSISLEGGELRYDIKNIASLSNSQRASILKRITDAIKVFD